MTCNVHDCISYTNSSSLFKDKYPAGEAAYLVVEWGRDKYNIGKSGHSQTPVRQPNRRWGVPRFAVICRLPNLLLELLIIALHGSLCNAIDNVTLYAFVIGHRAISREKAIL